MKTTKLASLALGLGLALAACSTAQTDKFVGGIPRPTLWNLALYWLAQWFIAHAAVRPQKAA